MKKLAYQVIFVVLTALVLAVPAMARGTLVPVGQAVGLELDGKGLTVAGFDKELGDSAKAAGLNLGDTIIKAQGQPVETAEDLVQQVKQCQGTMTLTILRPEGEQEVLLEPAKTVDGKRLGIYVREGITGIGTVTYYDPDTGAFGTLGHGVSDSQGVLMPLEGGKVYPAEIITIQRGKSGTPGQLQGAFRSRDELGQLEKNTKSGVFGTSRPFAGTPLPVAENNQIHTGSAKILSDLAGGQPKEYSVEILQVYSGSAAAGRNLLLHVTDPELIKATGGIVQGMSGSPIIQDGRLIGAVTHVLVNNPTRGYGIFIENMLEAA